jgi:hypothetical protein
MILLLALLSIGHAGELVERPSKPQVVSGQCLKSFPIRRGQAFAPEMVRESGVAACSAVAVPLSDYADLLQTEEWAEAIAAQYRVETFALESDRDWYKRRLEAELEPLPFLERPGTQRWLGRVETLVTVGIVAVGLGASYQYGSGGLR